MREYMSFFNLSRWKMRRKGIQEEGCTSSKGPYSPRKTGLEKQKLKASLPVWPFNKILTWGWDWTKWMAQYLSFIKRCNFVLKAQLSRSNATINSLALALLLCPLWLKLVYKCSTACPDSAGKALCALLGKNCLYPKGRQYVWPFWFKAIRVTSESWSCLVLIISFALLPQRSSKYSNPLLWVFAPNFCGLEPNRKYLKNEKWLRFVLKCTPCLTSKGLLDGILPIFLPGTVL